LEEVGYWEKLKKIDNYLVKVNYQRKNYCHHKTKRNNKKLLDLFLAAVQVSIFTPLARATKTETIDNVPKQLFVSLDLVDMLGRRVWHQVRQRALAAPDGDEEKVCWSAGVVVLLCDAYYRACV
jgi:hypothetical protein